MTNYVLQGRNVNTLWARAVPLIMTIGSRRAAAPATCSWHRIP
jgi:hypothetical protein